MNLKTAVTPESSPFIILPGSEYEPQLHLVLAGRSFSVGGIPQGWQELLPDRLLTCKKGGQPRSGRLIQIKISSKPHLRPQSEPHDLNETSHLSFSADHVSLVSDWCEAGFGTTKDSPVQLLVHKEASPWFADVLENVLRVLVAYDVLLRGGVMLHCAAIVKNNQAVVLFGHSGAGKSTSSALALENGCSVVSDDINIIEPGPEGWQVCPIPFSGSLNAVSDVKQPVPLRGLYHLNKAEEDRVKPCSAARAVSLLAGSAPFINQDAYRANQLIDILSGLSMQIGVQDLYFTVSDHFLQNVF